MAEKVQRIRRLREGGHVSRCHVIPHIGEYDVARHSWHASVLLMELHPNPSLNLLKAVLLHDVQERWVGDMPAPAKWYDQLLGYHYAQAEKKALEAMGLGDPTAILDVSEAWWLKAVDSLELFLWCEDQLALGNRNVERCRQRLLWWVRDNRTYLPDPVLKIFDTFEWEREEELFRADEDR